MKSLIRQRREMGATCDICNSPDYRIEPPYEGASKPNIVCNSCGHSWQYGFGCGIYGELSKPGDFGHQE
jgi:hypothetical protein